MSCSLVANPRAFQGVPSFFRHCCRNAARGGPEGYFTPGWHLHYHATQAYRLMPYSMETYKDWYVEVRALLDLIEMRDERGVERWYVEWFPKCIGLVPKRRRARFVQGVLAAQRGEDQCTDEDDDDRDASLDCDLSQFFHDASVKWHEQQLADETLRATRTGGA